MAGRSLVFFTLEYPYSPRQSWKRHELEVLLEVFDEVYVAPLCQNDETVDPHLPASVELLPAIIGRDGPMDLDNQSTRRGQLMRLGAAMPRGWKHRWALPRHYYPGWLQRSQNHIRSVEYILQSSAFHAEIAPIAQRSVCYFYWGAGYALALPFLDREIQRRSLVRFHGFDLYGHRFNDHMPYQTAVISSAACCAAVSRSGAAWLRDLVPAASHRIRHLPSGTIPFGRAKPSEDGILRLVSCAYARPVKRLHLIAEALAQVRCPVAWTHIGDGPELERVTQVMSRLPKIECNFVGSIVPEEVPRFYDGRRLDLFLNVSSSEGLPVSIMEAMSAGIPTLATDVGGTAELVDASVGKLLPEDIAPATLAREIDAFAALPGAERIGMRGAAAARISESYDIRKNTVALAEVLLEMSAIGRQMTV